MKYCESDFVVTGEYEAHLRERTNTFVHFTKAKDAIHTVLVTTYCLKENLYSGSIYDTITIDDMFVP